MKIAVTVSPLVSIHSDIDGWSRRGSATCLDVQRQRAAERKIQEPEKFPARTEPEEHLAVPYLAVHDGPKAIEFYKHAFGAAETLRFEDDGGRIVITL